MAQDIRVEPIDPDAARAEIERTRARMSHTIDEIEDVLLRKRNRLQERLDVVARVREKPLQAAGIVLGVGLLIGFLTGRGDGDEQQDRLDAEERAALWEQRARRLLAIARAQEADIEELESVAPAHPARGVLSYEDDDDEWDEEPSRWSELREVASERLAGFLGEAARQVLEGVRRRS